MDSQNAAGLWATFELQGLSDLADAISRTRRMFDLDADPEHIDETLGSDPVIGPLRRQRPGVRVPGAVDGYEAALGAIIGQQISVAGANTMMGRLVDAAPAPIDSLHRTFPDAMTVANMDLSSIGLTTRRQATIRALTDSVLDGAIDLDPGADRESTRVSLLELPGIGPWTADVIAMRALGDPDVLLASDLVIGRRLAEANSGDLAHLSPWRSYVTCTLWATRDDQTTLPKKESRS